MNSPAKSDSPKRLGHPSLRAGAARGPQPPSWPTPSLSITHPPMKQGATFQGGFRQPERAGRGTLSVESALVNSRPQHQGLSRRIRAPRPATEQPVEFHRLTLWSHPFASKRFHILFNSLFKVFFNFPSRYLFTIGHLSVFSLRWSLPPTLGCIPKQPDSKDATRDGS